jgi:hypothetical protein
MHRFRALVSYIPQGPCGEQANFRVVVQLDVSRVLQKETNFSLRSREQAERRIVI